ncbi:zinc finger protein 700-like [Rhipicephalus sanguineus]|uniref:zinc finger protein 700-like n=1 Tax=Rhipicephalus sanguineus TaxID=34632 RepID=UPI001893687B|nr:zinc finger protein 700-like [Rhipicephalus sanguineus]
MRMISSSERREAGSGLQSCVVVATNMAQAIYDSNAFSVFYGSRIAPSTSLAYSEYATSVPLDLSCHSRSPRTVNSAVSSDATKHTTRKALEEQASASFDYNGSIPGVSGESSSRQLEQGTLVDDPALSCPTCDFTFASTANFRKHVEHHEAGRRHLCRECGALYRTPSELKERSHTHTGERPYQCGRVRRKICHEEKHEEAQDDAHQRKAL